MFAQIEQKKYYIIKQEKCAKNHPDEASWTEFKTCKLLLVRKEQGFWNSLDRESSQEKSFNKVEKGFFFNYYFFNAIYLKPRTEEYLIKSI